MAKVKGTPHRAKPSHKTRKHFRNYVGRDRKNLSQYVVRMKRRGTYRERKGISKSSG